jgi:hypothetical protein
LVSCALFLGLFPVDRGVGLLEGGHFETPPKNAFEAGKEIKKTLQVGFFFEGGQEIVPFGLRGSWGMDPG